MNDYNTIRPALILKEYGRNMQKLVEHIKTIEDKEKRSESAEILIELMKLINPNARDSQENSQKLWDDLFIMSDFDLDIDSPYPMPEREVLNKKPERLGYKTSEIRFKHYGRNIKLLIDKAIELQDPEEKDTGRKGRHLRLDEYANQRSLQHCSVEISDLPALRPTRGCA